MSTKISFQAEHRTALNRSGLKRLRQEGRLPGVIQDADRNSVMVHICVREFRQWARRGPVDPMELTIEGAGTIPVTLEGFQKDPVTRDFVHVDFKQVI